MKTKLQFTLSKLGIAWMFALITVNFNRVAIVDLRVPALIVAVMIGLYPFFGPFQPMLRRVTDRFPIGGYRRSPWLVLGMVSGALVFPFLPTVVVAMSAGVLWAYAAGFVLFFWFGLMIALMANTYLDLISECTREDERSGVFAAAWTGQTAIIVVWALIFRWMMPDYSFERMQLLYTITPVIVAVLAVASVWKLEQPSGAQFAMHSAPATGLNTLRSSIQLLRGNSTAQAFFAFIVFTFLGIFTQDLIQEVWAGELFGMRVGESVIFQQIFNGMVTIGMAFMGIFAAKQMAARKLKALPMAQRKRIASVAAAAATASFVALALASLLSSASLAIPAFFAMGLSVGVFTFSSVTMMSDMTVPGQTENYLGLWSIAQAIGLGSSFILSGVLHSLLIGSGLLPASAGYAVIFGIEGGLMLMCAALLRDASEESLRRKAAGEALNAQMA